MPQPSAAASHSDLRPRNTIFRRRTHASKSSAIAVAATATVLVVAIISGLVFWYFWRRKTRRNRGRHGGASSVDSNNNTLQDGSSKIPLIRVEDQFQARGDGGSLAPLDHEEEATPIIAPNIPHRTMSGSTIQSLPPSYAVAIRSSPRPLSQVVDESDTATHRTHRSSSSVSQSGGLRPLMLVNTQRSSGDDHEETGERGRLRTPLLEENSNDNGSSASQQRLGVRPTASSRFREEDLDT